MAFVVQMRTRHPYCPPKWRGWKVGLKASSSWCENFSFTTGKVNGEWRSCTKEHWRKRNGSSLLHCFTSSFDMWYIPFSKIELWRGSFLVKWIWLISLQPFSRIFSNSNLQNKFWDSKIMWSHVAFRNLFIQIFVLIFIEFAINLH